MNSVLEQWNRANPRAAADAMMACCASRRWAEAMVAERPIVSASALREAANRIWSAMGETDWLEAFAAHPRIGERKAAGSKQSAAWSEQEQAGTAHAGDDTMHQMAEFNTRYEQQFGFTFIICASSKSADDMLTALKRRLSNDRNTELREAAEQQRQIMQLRLGKWLQI